MYRIKEDKIIKRGGTVVMEFLPGNDKVEIFGKTLYTSGFYISKRLVWPISFKLNGKDAQIHTKLVGASRRGLLYIVSPPETIKWKDYPNGYVHRHITVPFWVKDSSTDAFILEDQLHAYLVGTPDKPQLKVYIMGTGQSVTIPVPLLHSERRYFKYAAQALEHLGYMTVDIDCKEGVFTVVSNLTEEEVE